MKVDDIKYLLTYSFDPESKKLLYSKIDTVRVIELGQSGKVKIMPHIRKPVSGGAKMLVNESDIFDTFEQADLAMQKIYNEKNK
jgi:hypothetical protein